ncbi:MAG: hypothetical protein MJ120_02335 [Clostridia bacterium]|nr:hypothetical protein [Clostridia bacterium]
MACFTATVAEAVIVTVAAQIIKKKENNSLSAHKFSNGNAALKSSENEKIRFSRKLMWLAKLLWGGSFLLAFEHLWHGEVVPWFPFLTAMTNSESTTQMLYEIATVGVAMAVLLTAVWAVMVIVSNVIEKRKDAVETRNEESAV